MLKRTVTIHKEEGGGWFLILNHHHAHSHSTVPTHTVAGRNVQETANQAIEQVGTQDRAGQELHYTAPTVTIASQVLADTSTTISNTEGMFSSSSRSSSQQTPSVPMLLWKTPTFM